MKKLLILAVGLSLTACSSTKKKNIEKTHVLETIEDKTKQTNETEIKSVKEVKNKEINTNLIQETIINFDSIVITEKNKKTVLYQPKKINKTILKKDKKNNVNYTQEDIKVSETKENNVIRYKEENKTIKEIDKKSNFNLFWLLVGIGLVFGIVQILKKIKI